MKNILVLFILLFLNIALPACSIEESSYEDSYQFNFNDCDTEKHTFKDSDAEKVKQQICAALQDEKLNHSCAQDMRKSEFSKKCSGMKWDPK